MTKEKEEFYEGYCSGLKYQTEYRYVIEENSKIIGYFKISTPDNKNYTVDFNYSNGYEIDFDNIMYLVKRVILKRQKDFKLFVKLKNYINTNDLQKTYFDNKGFKCIKTKLLLTKAFAPTVTSSPNFIPPINFDPMPKSKLFPHIGANSVFPLLPIQLFPCKTQYCPILAFGFTIIEPFGEINC